MPNNAPTVTVRSVGSPGLFSATVRGRLRASDPERNTLTFTGSTTELGTVAVSRSGSFTYTPTKEAQHAAAAPDGRRTDSVGITVDDGLGGVVTTLITVPIKPRDGVDALYAPRRTVLDALLVDAARASGAEVVHQVRVVDLLRGAAGRVRGVVVERDGKVVEIEAEIVIGADGLRSTVARLAGAEIEHSGRHATGVVYGYWSGLELAHTHWYYRERVGVGAIPTNDGATCIFAGTSGDRFRSEIRGDVAGGHLRLLQEGAPALAAKLTARRQLGRHFAFTGATGFLRRSWGPGWALVGDAAYFKDPITAHGMTDALRDAELLARAVQEGSETALASYQDRRDELARTLHDISDRIASFEWTLDEIQVLHLALSREMNREVEAILELEAVADGPPALGRTA